jgi:Raf kinase inhibitor-like YbhB/YbcL family protein
MMRMTARTVITVFVAVLFIAAVQPTLGADGDAAMALKLTSPAFQPDGMIPGKFTCDGADVSPALKWSDPPSGTQSLALIMDDPDAPGRTWVHWVLYDLPADAPGLSEGVPKQDKLESGALQGNNDFPKIGYGGPCPPRGPAHRYFFKLYALDAKTGLKAGATKAELERAMKGHILAQTELVGRYKR